MKFYLSLAFLFMAALSVGADANTVGGKIVHVATTSGDVLMFRVVGGVDTNRPACAVTLRYSVDKDSVHAPVVLTAFATGKTIGSIAGMGTCSLYGNSEDLSSISICPLGGCT